MTGEISWVKALQNYMTDDSDGFGKKMPIVEFKELTYQDKLDFHQMLTEAGIACTPPKAD